MVIVTSRPNITDLNNKIKEENKISLIINPFPKNARNFK